MTTVEQPGSVAASAILAPSSDADEGLRGPRSGSRSSTRPSAGGIEENSYDDIMSAGDCRGLAASVINDDRTKITSEQHAPMTKYSLIEVKQLKPLVAMPPPSDAATQSRLAKHAYSRLGRNLLFEARPAVRNKHLLMPLMHSLHTKCPYLVSIGNIKVAFPTHIHNATIDTAVTSSHGVCGRLLWCLF